MAAFQTIGSIAATLTMKATEISADMFQENVDELNKALDDVGG